MHAIHHPRFEFPRAVLLSVVAGALAIVITLLLATRLGDVSASGAASQAQARPTAVAGGIRNQSITSEWITHPFAPLVAHRLEPGWIVHPTAP